MSTQTYKYKNNWIHVSHDLDTKKEIICVQIYDSKTSDYYTKYVKSFRSAQIFITKFLKRIKNNE